MLFSATRVVDRGSARCLAGAIALVVMGAVSGCNGPAGSANLGPVGSSTHALTCNGNNGGGDLTCPCTLNAQCNNFDDDTRLIICNVPSGGTVGTCFDCFALASARPIGCFCSAAADCATGSECNGLTCQAPVARGFDCHQNSDCGTDALGTMTCLPTKRWCGALPDADYCDFQGDCITGEVCSSLGVCSSGGAGFGCTKDSDCNAPLICYSITHECAATLPDGSGQCDRNAECTSGICSGFDGICGTVGEGYFCDPMNPAGMNAECTAPNLCTNCGAAGYLCLPAGGTC